MPKVESAKKSSILHVPLCPGDYALIRRAAEKGTGVLAEWARPILREAALRATGEEA